MSDDVQGLLERLSRWEHEYGVRFADDAQLASTGESNAAIAELKRQLDALGARYHWDTTKREYVLDAIGDAPGSEGEPA